jgi:uncharacterized protein with HEPN domain
MVPEDRDAALLLDIVNAVRDIEGFVEGVDFPGFANDKMLRYAVERQLIVIGEAARRLSDTLKETIRSVPWAAIIGLRNILAHEYGEILAERIWLVATRDLKNLLKEILPHLHCSEGGEALR